MAARKKDAPRMSDEDRRSIYLILKKNFAFDEDCPLANLGWCFVREGINKEDYGFLKLKPMLEEMVDFVSTSTKEIGGVSQSMFALHEFAPFEIDGASDDGDGRDCDGGSVSEEASEGAASDASEESSNETVVSNDADSSSDVEKKKTDTCVKEESNISNESKGKKSTKAQKDTIEPEASKERAEKAAKDQPADSAASRDKKGRNVKATARPALPPSSESDASASRRAEQGHAAASKESPQATAAPSAQKSDAASKSRQKPSAKGGEKQVDSAQKPAGGPVAQTTRLRRRVIPGKALERFGYLGSWQEFLSTLADLALDEPWDFCDEGFGKTARRFDILHNYIRYTFYRLTLEDKVGFSSEEDFAVFNTGLVDRHYEDIYACFEPSDPDKPEEARYPWAFAGFCTAGTGRLGKRLVRELNPLPQPASYLERKEDLLFDLDREIVCDVHHIVVDNVHRLPVNFLRDELASSQKCLGILAGIEELSEVSRTERFDRLRDVIEHDTRLFNRISTSINAAIDVAKRQVRWNYKTAVPAYYPRTNSMNLLLPLILTDSPAPDVALVVELQKSGNYQGQTVVTMAQAYRDARLLCRPYIDWLSPASIIDAAEEEDEEE